VVWIQVIDVAGVGQAAVVGHEEVSALAVIAFGAEDGGVAAHGESQGDGAGDFSGGSVDSVRIAELPVDIATDAIPGAPLGDGIDVIDLEIRLRLRDELAGFTDVMRRSLEVEYFGKLLR